MWAHQDLDKRLVKFQHQHPIVNRRRKLCTVVTSQHHRHLHSRIAVTKHVILLCLLFAAASSDAFLARAAGCRCTAARHSPSHEGLLGPRGQLETSISASDFAHSDLRHEPFGDEDLALLCVRIPKSSQAVLRSFEVSVATDTGVTHIVDKCTEKDRGDLLSVGEGNRHSQSDHCAALAGRALHFITTRASASMVRRGFRLVAHVEEGFVHHYMSVFLSATGVHRGGVEFGFGGRGSAQRIRGCPWESQE